MKGIAKAVATIILSCSTSVHAQPTDGGAAPEIFRTVVDADGQEHRVPLPGEDDSPESVPLSTDRAENGSFGAVSRSRAWTLHRVSLGAGTAAGSAVWVPLDVTGDPSSGSGSILIINISPADVSGSEVGLKQCLRPGRPVLGVGGCESIFAPQAKVRVPPDQTPGNHDAVFVAVDMFEDDNCSVPAPGGMGIGVPITPAGTNGWVTLNSTGQSGPCLNNPAIRSVQVRSYVLKQDGNAAPLQAYVDDVALYGRFQLVKGDIDRNGETDLLFHNNVTGENSAWFMKDENRISPAVPITPAPASPSWQIAGADDFNADGDMDLLFWNGDTGATEFWSMDGTTRIGAPAPLAGAPALPWRPAATADFNHDQRPDIVFRNANTQKLSIWTMNGTTHVGTITPSPDQAVNANWELASAQDLNADTHTDLLWYNATSGKIVMWLMDANGVRLQGGFTNPANAGANNWKVVAGGDFGIGPGGQSNTSDIVWRNTTSGRVVIWYMDAAGNRTAGLFATPDPPAPATNWTIVGPK